MDNAVNAFSNAFSQVNPTPKLQATGLTVQSMLDAGWTPEALLEHGYVEAATPPAPPVAPAPPTVPTPPVAPAAPAAVQAPARTQAPARAAQPRRRGTSTINNFTINKTTGLYNGISVLSNDGATVMWAGVRVTDAGSKLGWLKLSHEDVVNLINAGVKVGDSAPITVTDEIIVDTLYRAVLNG